MFFLWSSHPHQHIPIRIPISSCLCGCGSNPWYPKSQLVNGWFLSQSYGKFISFDPSPYSHRKSPIKKLGPNGSSSLLPWMRSASDLRTLERSFAAAGNFGNWMEESWRVTMGKSTGNPWCFTFKKNGGGGMFCHHPMLGEWWEPWL